jgi:hypothetical protein
VVLWSKADCGPGSSTRASGLSMSALAIVLVPETPFDEFGFALVRSYEGGSSSGIFGSVLATSCGLVGFAPEFLPVTNQKPPVAKLDSSQPLPSSHPTHVSISIVKKVPPKVGRPDSADGLPQNSHPCP